MKIMRINALTFYLLAAFFLLMTPSCKKNSKSYQEPVTFTFFSSDLTGPEAFDNLIAKKITEETGVKLDFKYSTLNQTDAILLMIADDSFSDFIYAKGDLTKLIEANAVIPLDDYIEKYGQNMKKLYGDQIVRLRNTIEDPSIYSVGTYEIRTKKYEISGNMQIQHAVLKEFGYPKITTLEDYENILIAYMKKYPEINGHKTIGYSIFTDSWYWYLTLSNPGNYAIGYPDDGQWIVDQETMKAVYKFLHPQMNLYYKWLNKIYHEGLLDPESFTQNYDLWNSKVKGGYVLGVTYPLWGLKDIKNEMIDEGLAERTFAYLPVTASEKYKDPSTKDYGFSGGWGIAISKSCKDPVRAFKFLDWMCSEEAQILNNWGIEGMHYYYDNQGIRRSYPSINESDGVGKYTYPFPQGGSGYIDSTGNPLSKETKSSIIQNYSDVEKDTLYAYGAELWSDLFPSSSELGISKHGQVWQYPLSSNMTRILEEADEYVKKSLINMIIGSSDDFDNSWEQMQQGLHKIGVDWVGEEVTNMIKMKMQLWQN